MVDLLEFKKSTREGKKYMMVLNNDGRNLTIHFGQEGSRTFLDHGDKKLRENYLKRHKANEDWTKINAGSASRYILWNKETLSNSLKSFMSVFNIKDKRSKY